MTPTFGDLARQAADRLAHRSSTASSEGRAHRSSTTSSEGRAENPSLDAEVLARHVLGWDRARWLADAREPAPAAFADRFDALVARRETGEPVAYITGTREFFGLDFEVTPAVLIPRPETELLVEEALRWIRDGARIADVGTGSGCIAVAIAHTCPGAQVVATDISEAALDVAVRNAARHDVLDRIDFRLASGLDGVGPVDLVVSNPPYIPQADGASLMKDVVDFEPHSALFAGGDGLDVIRATLAAVASRTPAPAYIFEFGGNDAAVTAAVAESGLRVTNLIKDLAGIPRIAVVER